MTADLVLDNLEHAIWTRSQDGITDLTGLVHHTDAGSQYASFVFPQRLIDVSVDPSVRSVGDAYDNAMAESQIGIHKIELIPRKDPGGTSITSRGKPCSGPTGSTTTAPTNPSTTSPRSRSS